MSQPERSVDEQREALAAAFGREIDPLAVHAETFELSGIDPFQMFLVEVIEPKGLAVGTVGDYERAVEQWREHMAEEGRHPACPAEAHFHGFVDRYLEKGNRPDVVKKKLPRLNKAYEYWQNDSAFPHPHDFNPFRSVMSKRSLSKPDGKEPPRIPIDELAEPGRGITNIRDRAIVVCQLKLGLRVRELCNMQLREVSLSNREIRRFYPELGHTLRSSATRTPSISPLRPSGKGTCPSGRECFRSTMRPVGC